METLHPKIQAEIDKLDRQRERVAGWQPIIEIAEKIKDKFKDDHPGDGALTGIMVSCGVGDGSINGVMIHFHGLVDFKQVLPIRQFIRTLGLPAPKSEHDYDSFGRKGWTYKTEHGPLVLLAWFPVGDEKEGDKDARCRFVKVGEEMKPVYKLMCDGEELDVDEVEKSPVVL